MKKNKLFVTLLLLASTSVAYSQTWNGSTVSTTVGTHNSLGVTTPTTKVLIQEDNPVLEIKDTSAYYAGPAAGNNGGSAGIKLTIPYNKMSYELSAGFSGVMGPIFRIQGTTGPTLGLTTTGIWLGGLGTSTSHTTYLTGPTQFMGTANTFSGSTTFNGTSNYFFNLTVGNTANANNVVLSSKGKVVIGDVSNKTTSNEYKLFVQSGILTEKVKIALVPSTNWPDFVFDKKYKLRSLESVEAYINENKHLPEVPSASEVEKNGLDVAEMDAKLLQKIEELTLYMIEMKKENIEMKKENESLKKRLDVIESNQ